MNHCDYGFRIYNPGIGRFLSVDPLTRDYPWYTPYQFAGNSPIVNKDLDGLEDYYYLIDHFDKQGRAMFRTDDDGMIFRFVNNSKNPTFFDKNGVLQYKHGERHIVLFQGTYDVLDLGMYKGTYTLGKTYASNEDALNAQEDDFTYEAIKKGALAGVMIGEDIADKILFIRGLAKQGIKSGTQEYIELALKKGKSGKWLPTISKTADDWAKKGAHVHVDDVEIAIKPGQGGELIFESVFSKTDPKRVQEGIKKVKNALEDPTFRKELIDKTKGVRDRFKSGTPAERAKSGEMNFLIKALEKLDK